MISPSSSLPTTYSGLTTCDDWICASCLLPRRLHDLDPVHIDARESKGLHAAFVRQTYPFVGMLRVKNEARWIAEVLESILPLCLRVYVMDDHSTDDTARICRSYHPQVTVFESPFSGINESRDKNWLMDQIVRECAPEWVLCVDGDEVLESGGPQIIRDYVKSHHATATQNQAYALKIEYFWNDRHTVRVDRIYADFWRPSIFRPYAEDPVNPQHLDMSVAMTEFRWKSTPFGRHVEGNQPNLHCSSVPQRCLDGHKNLPARLKHYGYMDRADRVRKLDYYTAIDWKNQAEDWYRHMCAGDYPALTELPRTMELVKQGRMSEEDVLYLVNVSSTDRLLHAGPVEVRKWEEGREWEMSEFAKRKG